MGKGEGKVGVGIGKRYSRQTMDFIEADLGDTVGSVPDLHNKVNIARGSHKCFGFPVHITVMFTLYCSQLSVQ